MVEQYRKPETKKKPNFYFEDLANLTSQISKKLNERMNSFLPECKEASFDEEGRVNINSYNKESGGKYEKTTVDKDTDDADRIEAGFLSDPNKDTVQAYYKDKTGRNDLTVEEVKQEIRKEFAQRDGNVAEIAINALFNKVLAKKNLVVARASKFDDVKNHIDTFIFDPETGEIVCGFDEVNYQEEEQGNGNFSDRKSKKEGIDKKKEKVLNTARKGGEMLKYAYRLSKDESGQPRVIQGSVMNLPVLYLGISKNDLMILLEGMDYANSDDVNEVETKIFEKICSSIDEQLVMLRNISSSKQFNKNLEKLPEFLKKLKK